MPIKEAAKSLLDAGLSAVPVMLKDKYPRGYGWKQYQSRLMKEHELGIFDRFDALCIICGLVSGGLEVIDFDDGGSQFAAWLSSLRNDRLVDRIVVEESPSGGYHVFYRCEEIEGNQKLARSASGEVLIETRGEGGLIVCHPSPGYELTSGRLEDLPTITPDERQQLLDAARSLDQKPEPQQNPYNAAISFGDPETPWGDYNKRGDFRAVLSRAGWTKVRDPIPGDDNERWRRPGKDEDGHSATINGDRVFYCWSSNATPFDEQKGYSPFDVFKKLEHNGDAFQAIAAAKELGFGVDDTPGHWADVAERLVANSIHGENDSDTEKDELPKLDFDPKKTPGLIGEIVRYQLKTAIYPQPILALASAISVMSVITGRKIRDEQDGRTNILTISLAPTGSGKEHGRKCCRKILHAAGAPELVASEGVMSSTAILSELRENPACLFMLDEIQSLFSSIASRKAGRHIEQIPEVIKTAYSSADNEFWKPAAYADRSKKIEVNQPHLVLFATGVPSGFWSNIDHDMLCNGFLGRVLLFEVDKHTAHRTTKWQDPPDSIVSMVRHWVNYQPGGNLDATNPQPLVVPWTASARKRLEGHMKDIRTRHKSDDALAEALWSRSGQKACQLALLLAASRMGASPQLEVDGCDAELAIVLSNWSTRRMIWNAENSLSHGEHGRLANMVLTSVPRSWCSKTTITKRTKNICTRSQRDSIIKDLLESEDIECREVKTQGRPRVEFRRAT